MNGSKFYLWVILDKIQKKIIRIIDQLKLALQQIISTIKKSKDFLSVTMTSLYEKSLHEISECRLISCRRFCKWLAFLITASLIRISQIKITNTQFLVVGKISIKKIIYGVTPKEN